MAQTALAQTSSSSAPTSPCDVKYYESLKSRAWMEAQREITQNQNLIFKPDSVMQYTCFDRFMNVLAGQASNMFSETSRWGTIPGLGSTSMDSALESLVGKALGTYISANFSHASLGGRGPGNYTPGSVSGGSYTCDQMIKVWTAAKCIDFIAEEDHDGFYTFDSYQKSDKRKWPAPCKNDGLSTRWKEAIDKSTESLTPWEEDKVKTYFELMDYSKCASALKISTGVVAERKSDPRFYYEKVCVAPGCNYVPGGSGTEESPSNTGQCKP